MVRLSLDPNEQVPDDDLVAVVDELPTDHPLHCWVPLSDGDQSLR